MSDFYDTDPYRTNISDLACLEAPAAIGTLLLPAATAGSPQPASQTHESLLNKAANRAKNAHRGSWQ